MARDVYASTWKEILAPLFVGDRERIPNIRHDLLIKDWDVIGKILLKDVKILDIFLYRYQRHF